MKFLILTIIALMIVIGPSFVYAQNDLQDTKLTAQSGVIFLEIDFGKDTVKHGFTRTYVTNHLDDLSLTFYGDEIILSDPKVKITSTGDNFRISSLPEGIIMYGHRNHDVGNYNINLYLPGDDVWRKVTVSSFAQRGDDDEKVIESEIEVVKEQYIPDLLLTSSHDFRTYWKETFNIDVQAFDGKINSDPKQSDFDGRLDGVDVKVLISLNDNKVAELSGVTANHGHWDSGYFFEENITTPGEYNVDILLSYLGKQVSKSSTMFVIGTVGGNDSSNHPPISNAGSDQSVIVSTEVTLDASASVDPDGDSITYLWTQTSGGTVELSDSTAEFPTFTPDSVDSLVFQLAVTDSKGKFSSDSVIITVE